MEPITLKMAKKRVKSYNKRNEKMTDNEKKFIKKHKFSCSEIWNLDTSIALYILPRLVYFRDHANGYPCIYIPKAKPEAGINDNVDSDTDNIAFQLWIDDLNKMINAFYTLLDEEYIFHEEKRSIIKEGLKVFAEYFEYLWL